MRKNMLFIYLLLIIFPFLSNATEIPKAIEVKELKLKNGLTVYLNEDHNQPNVMGLVVVRGGSKRDPKDATGIAHYFEHIMFKGSEKLGTIDYQKEKVFLDSIEIMYDNLAVCQDKEQKKKIQLKINDLSIKAAEFAIPNELDKVLSAMGGSGVNAYTNMESIVYHNVFPENQMEKWMEVYYDRFSHPVFRLFQSELETVYEEKNMYSDDPFEMLFEEVMRNLYRSHPYGQQTVLGSIEHLKTPSLRKMKEYFETYYVPNNMAILLSGDFKSENALPLIEKTFGQMKAKEVPPMPEYIEEPFNGREFVSKRYTPVKLGVMAYHTVNATHKDANTVEVTNNILSNYSSTGLLDQLSLDNKLMMVGAEPDMNVDLGGTFFFFVPKLVGQSLKNAEKLVDIELEKVRKGEFCDELLASVKQTLIKEHNESLENVRYRSYYITDAFLNNVSWTDYLKYPEYIEKITKDDVIRVAKKYYGNNKMVLYSKMGFPKKHKLEKPPYKPVVPKNAEAQSEFAKEIAAMPVLPSTPSYIEFNEDVKIVQIQDKVHLYVSKNKINDIFSLRFQFGTGKFYNPLSEATANLLDYCGAGDLKTKEFKAKMQKLGVEFYAYTRDNNFIINFTGLESNFDESIKLINELFNNPNATQEDVKKVAQMIKFNEKYASKDPYSIGNALSNYALFSERSTFVTRKSSKDIKKLEIDQLLDNFKEVLKYEVDIHYCGKLSENDVKHKLANNIQFSDKRLASKVLEQPKREQYQENTILVVNDKKALQSQIYFFVEGEALTEENRTISTAFNKYFGGDMNSIVFQEIREFRSLGYSAWGNYRTPLLNNESGYLKGFVGTQSDKTIDAVDAYINLIVNMPEKEERLENIISSLTQSINSERPTFRYLSSQVAYWNKQGYKNDPRKDRMSTYQNLKFDDITNFYKENIKGKPYVITIVGDASRFNLDELKKYGKIIELDKKDIYNF